MKSRALYLCVFTACLSALSFEMVHIRVFAYSLPPILAYAGISMAMTGIGLGAMVLFFRRTLLKQNFGWTCAALLALQSLSMVLAFVVFSRESWGIILDIQDHIGRLIFLIILPCSLPYVFFGLFLGLVFSHETIAVGRVYFFNLAGSGLGCILIVLLMQPLGAEKLILVSAMLSALAGLTATLSTQRAMALLCLGLALAGAAALPAAQGLFPFSPDPVDAVGYGIRYASEDGKPTPARELSEWNMVGRVEVWNGKSERLKVPETLDLRILSVDSGATTQLVQDPRKEGWGRALFEETVYGMAYAARPEPEKVLVVGAGGGIDVNAALHWNARHVTAVEINASTVRAVAGPFAAFLGWPEKTGRVRIVHGDGRSFVKGTPERFDVIQMTGVDTMTMYATGSITMAEEFLYTREAFEDLVSALKPGGVLCILRYGREHLRLTAMATAALLEQGASDPGRHIVSFRQSNAAGIMVKKTPFTESELDAVQAYARNRARSVVSIPHFEKWNFHLSDPIELLHLPGRSSHLALGRYFVAAREKSADFEAMQGAMTMPTDDRPFYMLSSWMDGKAHPGLQETFKVLKVFWISLVAFAFLMVLVPSLAFRGAEKSRKPFFWVLPYFFFIGAGFMMIELGLISRFAVFLGSPGASVAFLLAGLLVASGIGSAWTEGARKSPERCILAAAILFLASSAFLLFLAKPVFNLIWTLGWGPTARGFFSAFLVAPLGFSMGCFFPSGLKIIRARFSDSRPVVWAVSINGFASVAGSVAALPVAMAAGFRVLMLSGMLGYALAVVTLFLSYGRQEAPALLFRRQPSF